MSVCRRRCAGSCARINRQRWISPSPARRASADSATALMSFALAGCGIALLPAWLVAEKVAQRELVPLLSEYHFPQQGVYALYPDAQHMPTRVRAFIDFLREKVG